MALVAATHHSAQQNGALRKLETATRAGEGEVHEKHDAPQTERTSPGERPGLPPEPGPQRSDRSLPSLAGASCEAVDSSLRFLTASALEARREEEKEKENEKMMEQSRLELRSLLEVPGDRRSPQQASRTRTLLQLGADMSSSSKRKRKKKRKKKLPKTRRPPLPRC